MTLVFLKNDVVKMRIFIYRRKVVKQRQAKLQVVIRDHVDHVVALHAEAAGIRIAIEETLTGKLSGSSKNSKTGNLKVCLFFYGG